MFDEVHDYSEVDIFAEELTKIIENAADKSIPKKLKCVINNLKLPSYIINLIKIRNTVRRHWQRYRLDFYQQNIKFLNEQIKKEINIFRNENWNRKLQKLDKCSKPFWNITKIMKKKFTVIPTLDNLQNASLTYTQKADILASSFHNNHLISNGLGDNATTLMVVETIGNLSIPPLQVNESNFISYETLSDLISELSIRKSSGLDNIKNLYLQKLPKRGVEALLCLFNFCIKMQYFPLIWKKAKIIPILKPGSSANISSNYRPISLLSSLSKLFEKCISTKINQILDEQNILLPQQFGFRNQHSTIHQVDRITQHIKNSFSQQKSTGLVLLDVEKAFDSVWHDGLLCKMIRFGFPNYLVKLIKSFLTDRSYVVCVNNNLSAQYNIPAGVPQGSVLGPYLYNIYTSDFPELPNCDITLYADDTGIYSSDVFGSAIETNLQSALNIIFIYFHKWKIKVNASKTQAIFFTKKRKTCFLPSNPLKIDNIDINWKDNVKFLGLILDTKLTYSKQIANTVDKINKTIKIMYPLINRKSLLSRENKLIIYKTIFQSFMLYGCPVWGKCAKTHIRKLQISQNKLLKLMLNLPWHFSTLELHEQSNIDTVSFRISKLYTNYSLNCSISDNILISSLVN